MQSLIEDFGQYLRHERGQSEHTQKAYCNILNRFADWAKGESIERWNGSRSPIYLATCSINARTTIPNLRTS